MRRLEEILDEVSATLRSSSDPFSVRVLEILDELRDLLPRMRDEDLLMDSEIILKLAEVVREQGEWLRRESTVAALGRIIALLKLSMDPRSLAEELLEAWSPIVDLEQVTLADVHRSLSYLQEKRIAPPSREMITLRGSLKEIIPEEPDLEEILDEVREIVRKMEEPIPYRKVVSGSPKEVLLKAYAIAFLASSGEISLVLDPVEEELYVTKPSPGKFFSYVIPVRRFSNARPI